MRLPSAALSLILACSAVVVTGCLESASRTQLIPPSGECLEADLADEGAPGAECVFAEDCSAFCCECPAAGEFAAQLCLAGACADASTTCDDAATNAALCQ